MTTHVHDDLPGYDARQILVDGCGFCETIARDMPDSIRHLDDFTLCRGINRATQWTERDVERTGPISSAEVDLLKFLRTFSSVTRRLTRMGYDMSKWR